MVKKKKKKQNNKSTTLGGHKRVGKKLIPPMVNILGSNFRKARWFYNIFPEILWIAILIHKYGWRKTISDLDEIIKQLYEIIQDNKKKKIFAFISDYTILNDEERKLFLKRLNYNTKCRLEYCLNVITYYYPKCPLNWLSNNKVQDIQATLELGMLKSISKKAIDRSNKFTMELQATVLYLEQRTGKVIYTEDVQPPNLNEISNYPLTEESKRIAASIRADINNLEEFIDKESDWLSYYWTRTLEISSCTYPNIEKREVSKDEDVGRINKIYNTCTILFRDLNKELEEITYKYKLDLRDTKKFEVLTGMLSRNAQFLADLCSNISNLFDPISKIILRCMFETRVRLKWYIKKGKGKDYDEFKEYGLGQEKLLLEHYKNLLDDKRPNKVDLENYCQQIENWINMQNLTMLLPIDLKGKIGEKNLRDMCIELNELNIHRYYLSPFSSYVHGYWNSICKVNLVQCKNPLHGFHFIPQITPRVIDIYILIDAANIYDDCYTLVNSDLFGEDKHSKAIDIFLNNVQLIFNKE